MPKSKANKLRNWKWISEMGNGSTVKAHAAESISKHFGRVGAQSGLGPGPGWGPYGPLWAHIWAHMGPYGPIYGPIWAHMGPYGPLWAHMGLPGQVLEVLEDSVYFP